MGPAQVRAVALTIIVLFATRAGGQEARRPPSDGTARLQQQVQQLASERTALQAENAGLKEKVARLEKESGSLAAEKESLARRAGAAEAKVGRAESGQQSAASRLATAEGRLNELVGKYKELAEQLRTIEAERGDLARRAATDGQALKVCAERNVQLADIALEALDRYQRKGCFGALAQAEPFTGLKRAEVENAVEDYRQRVDGLRLDPQSSAGGGKNDR
ncbi:MAG: hypothetical protein J0M16_11965 [Gammaproteobacteria bacterium]|nr:hypothetical protein [Gammaproteobacteria bacterium]